MVLLMFMKIWPARSVWDMHPEKSLGKFPDGAHWKGQFTFQSGIIFTSVTILIGKIYITYLSFPNDSDGKEKISIPKALF